MLSYQDLNNRWYLSVPQKEILSASASAQEIAETIFTSGISTADDIAIYSGRGVGMASFRSFLEKSGGSISVVLENEVLGPNQEERIAFHFSVIFEIEQISMHHKS